MALSKLQYNSINVTPAASKGIRFNSGADGFETASAGGNLVKISASTASSSAAISFTSGIDNTYKEYLFTFHNIHPATDNSNFTFQGNVSGGADYNETITSTDFQAYHKEDGTGGGVAYSGGNDQAQGTGFQVLAQGVGNDNDQNASGYLHLFDPSDTTFVKHFISCFQLNHHQDYGQNEFVTGYFNTTSAIDEIQFKMSSGNIDSGTITMYGLK
tara:strand:- start:391 stop:1035 length:645 start_codon:yes stop_codon:yes gene_type:complete